MKDPICDKCKEPLEDYGALAFSPPVSASWDVTKYCLCKKCWALFIKWLREEGL